MRTIVIDDSRSSLLAVVDQLSRLENCEPEGFLDPEEALARCRLEQFDLVLVDYVMPRMDGLEVLAALRALDRYATVPIVVITSMNDRDLKRRAIELGATDFLTKPFDWSELLARARNLLDLRQAQVELADRAARLAREVEAAVRHLSEREEEVIWRLARAVEYRDGTTGDHVSRVATISRLIAEALGFDQERQRMIYLAAPLHDIGKIGIADAILNKPGRLSADEFDQMRTHVSIGARILDGGSSELVRIAALIARTHHERWDGTGYPAGLAGEAIPIEGRIVAVADVFDALCSERPYKPSWPVERARAEILSLGGSHFDPACVAAFDAQWPKIADVLRANEATLAA
ncbi:HD domain-containing phosphohydrolase [Aquibium microcysteis]|uniref:HD domain-containing phosphohydrolase n=1 Tax=Aquibium microcysteis TaxID=675281 RepID=UPI00165D0A03|nr:HD domain-containing phosphohydrolase [Aquibium microcysteis]